MAARDYKHSGRGRGRGRRPLPGWVWLLSGLAIGLFVALLVYLEGRPGPAPSPPGISVTAPERAAPKAGAEPKQEQDRPPKPRFDFYTLLPELEVVIPEGDYTVKDQDTERPAPVEQPGSYILQAGSFRKFEEADRMKATLALLGVHAHIQRVQVNNDTWHRVRIGPYDNLKTLNEVRARLREHNIETMLVKAK